MATAYTTTVAKCDFEVEDGVLAEINSFSTVSSLVQTLSAFGYDLVDMTSDEFVLEIDVENGITLRIRVPRG